MKKILLFTALAAVLAGAGYAGTSCTNSYAMSGPDTLKINTTELGAEVIGYNGPTPVEISVFNGVIPKIKALPNRESPRFMRMVQESGLCLADLGVGEASGKDRKGKGLPLLFRPVRPCPLHVRRPERSQATRRQPCYVFAFPWGRPFEGGDKAVSDAMNHYWANFVKTGKRRTNRSLSSPRTSTHGSAGSKA